MPVVEDDDSNEYQRQLLPQEEEEEEAVIESSISNNIEPNVHHHTNDDDDVIAPPRHVIPTSTTTTTTTTPSTTVIAATTTATTTDTSTSDTTTTLKDGVDPSIPILQHRILQRRRQSSRSTQIPQQDPIIAPGFGTRRDLIRLARELSWAVSSSSSTSSSRSDVPTTTSTNTSIFTIDTIQYLMERRGRGIPKSSSTTNGGSGSTDEVTTSTSTTSAWDDFMKEAGMGSTTTATTATDTTTVVMTGKRGRSSAAAAATTTGSSSATATATSQPQRRYDLEALQLPSTTDPKKNKKSKTEEEDGGILLQTGTMDVTLIGRKNDTKKIDWEAPHTLSVPTIVPILSSISTKVRITKVIAAGHACHAVAISTTGTVYGWGRNEQSQLGSRLGTTNVYQPTLLLEDDHNNDGGPMYSAAVGKGHTILLSRRGQLMASGWNKSGQCGINHSGTEIVSNFKNCVLSGTSDIPNIAVVAAGEDFSVVLDTEGYMYSTGSSEYGQLGNGATGEYFIAANKIGFANAQTFIRRTTFCHAPNEKIYGNSDSHTKVVPISNEDIRLQQVVCGKHHCIALEANTMSSNNTEHQQPRVFTWGCGDYGVLGHGIQADEYYPRNVGALSNLRYTTTTTSVSEIQIAAGQHCSLLQTSNGHVYYWGKHRSVGEATMRPALVDALANNGHVVSQIGAGGQTVVCCTQHAQTVAWGQGTYGELGFGQDKKSSSKPSFVPGLEGCTVTSLACGYGTTLFVVRDDPKVMDQLPQLDVSVLETLAATEAAAVAAAGGNVDDEGDDDDAKPTKGRKGKAKK